MPAGRMHLLGRLEVTVDDREVALGGVTQRTVLAMLLSARPHAVSAARLVDAVWADDGPPPSASRTLQIYISRLRRIVDELGGEITHSSSAYTLQLPAVAVDADGFMNGLTTARELVAGHRHEQAVRALTAALALWRGDHALEGFQHEPWAVSFIADLSARRQEAQRLLADTLLTLGRPAAAIGILEPAARAAPEDEAAATALMLALYRTGRSADALTAFETCRRALADLGLEPSALLRDRQRAVLLNHDDLRWTSPMAAAPRLLPPRNHRFTGREAVVAEIQGLLDAREIVTVFGLGGTGKSSVALELAHRHHGLALWINAEDRVSAVTALVALAAALNIGVDTDSDSMLAAMWAQLAERDDWMLVFDDANAIEVVRSLVPPSRRGRILITSQNPAWGALGPTRELLPFAKDEAVAFVQRRAGRLEPQSAMTLAETLGQLPLALEQACAYIEQTGLMVAGYVQMFRRNHQRLLQRGAPAGHHTDVRTTWQLLIQDVRSRSPLAARVLETASFLAADEQPLSLFARAVGDDASELDVIDAIGELLRHSLISRDARTVRVHRLVQLVVRDDMSPASRIARATEVATAIAAGLPDDPTRPEHWPAWADMTAHIGALVRACGEPPPVVIALALRCCRYLRSFGALATAHELLDAAIAALGPLATHRPEELAELLAERGDVLDASGSLAAARDDLSRAVLLLDGRASTRPGTLARVYVRLAHAENCSDDAASAVGNYKRALDVLAGLGEPTETVRAYIGLGYASWSLDQFSDGEAQFRAALAICREHGLVRSPLTAEVLSGLGMMLHEQDQLEPARVAQEDALELLIAIFGDQDRAVVAETRDKYGYVLGLLGRLSESLEQHAQAAGVMERLFGGRDARVAITLSNLSMAESRVGEHDAARRHQRRAVDILHSTYGPDHRDTRLTQARLSDLENCAVQR